MTPDEAKREAQKLGKHIFDWGASMQGDNHSIEDYRQEREKAISQLSKTILSTTYKEREDAIKECAEVALDCGNTEDHLKTSNKISKAILSLILKGEK